MLLISAGVLNFRQRARLETPAWDGVEWVDTQQGIIATKIERASAGDKAWLLPGDKLIGIGFSETGKFQPIVRAKDVQIYLDQAEVGGKLHYLMERPSYPPESRFYYADLDDLGSVHKWDPRDDLHKSDRHRLSRRRILRSVQARRPRTVCSSLRYALSNRFCFPFLYAGRSLPRSRSGDRFSEECRVYCFRAVVPALLSAVSDKTATVQYQTLASE